MRAAPERTASPCSGRGCARSTIAGHILVKVFGSFIVGGLNAEGFMGPLISLLSFLFIIFVSALELLVCAIQAYVFALLTSLYINDAENLH